MRNLTFDFSSRFRGNLPPKEIDSVQGCRTTSEVNQARPDLAEKGENPPEIAEKKVSGLEANSCDFL